MNQAIISLVITDFTESGDRPSHKIVLKKKVHLLSSSLAYSFDNKTTTSPAWWVGAGGSKIKSKFSPI